jgi:hypothetical protein
LPGTITVGIRETDGAGHPTGDDLCSGTTDGNTLTDSWPGEWREITLGTGYNLYPDTKYAIVVRALTGNAANKVRWQGDLGGTYVGGNEESSGNAGTSWSSAAEDDCVFEEWGEEIAPPPPSPGDVAIETSAYVDTPKVSMRGGIFWTSPIVGYVIYVLDIAKDLKYRKTADGGATWGAAVNIRTGSIYSFDCWADWQTADDAGTKIHIAYIDGDSDDVRYVYLDTSTDTVGGDDQIEACQGTGNMYTLIDLGRHQLSITKTRGGNLAVALKYLDSDSSRFYEFYTSPDATTWTNEASPFEADNTDYILLFPGNEADNQDVWATFWDTSAFEIMLKTYDDSEDSWSEQSIAGDMQSHGHYMQMDGQIRLSDGHLIFAAWNRFDNPLADLMVWDINGAGSIVAKTNVITDTGEYFLVSVFINQVNDDIYVAYVGGTAAQITVKAFYQKSDDGGATWGGESALQADEEDDEQWISCGAMKAAWGGKFQPFWFNSDLHDLFTNTDNGVSIAAVAPPAAVMPWNLAPRMAMMIG